MHMLQSLSANTTERLDNRCGLLSTSTELVVQCYSLYRCTPRHSLQCFVLCSYQAPPYFNARNTLSCSFLPVSRYCCSRNSETGKTMTLGRHWKVGQVATTPLCMAAADTAFGPVRWSHITAAVEASLPADAKQGLSKPFYLMFWRFTISDIADCQPE